MSTWVLKWNNWLKWSQKWRVDGKGVLIDEGVACSQVFRMFRPCDRGSKVQYWTHGSSFMYKKGGINSMAQSQRRDKRQKEAVCGTPGPSLSLDSKFSPQAELRNDTYF